MIKNNSDDCTATAITSFMTRHTDYHDKCSRIKDPSEFIDFIKANDASFIPSFSKNTESTLMTFKIYMEYILQCTMHVEGTKTE